uniref:Cleavage and polyadenylation specificity factor subunit 2 n=1 Tax=Arcella intermedia TaxID=1963864 RepID=A0A6B2L931_9EUKA
MTSIIKFSPLCGAYNEDPLCYLLEIDEYRILLDCGWNDDYDVQLLKPLKRVVGKINAVLISHPDLHHLGALPYAVGKLGLKAKIIGTIPVYKMGQMFMYDAYQSRQNSEEFTVFNLDDVDAAFDNFVQLKYSQRYTLSGKGIKLEITPYAAGHLIGGTIWKIKRETDEIIYAVDYNHKKERHLSPTILETLTQPTLLITDALNALNSQDSRGNRDSLLIESITSTLRAGGNVLLPVDTAGRVLELLVILDQHWSHFHYSYPLLFLNNVAYNTIEFAKSQLEWMSEAIMNKFISHRENCFQFSNVKLCHKTSEVNEFPSPKISLWSGVLMQRTESSSLIPAALVL